MRPQPTESFKIALEWFGCARLSARTQIAAAVPKICTGKFPGCARLSTRNHIWSCDLRLAESGG